MTAEAWADRVLSSSDEDSLDRKHYAQTAAELIDSTFSFDASVVFGLTGAWGSGKSSFISFITEHLEKRERGWHVAHFTPWATSDEAGLIAEFYASLASELPVDRAKKLRKTLAIVAHLAAPTATLIPVAGATAADAVRIAADALATDKSWQQAFADAAKQIRKLQRPILVVVDDIDRLQQHELMTLLKVVRLLGRFPGVNYLLAYDDDTLHRVLATAGAATPNDGSAERFMEKIVQYPLVVPTLLRHQQIARLRAGLLNVTRQTDIASRDSGRIDALLGCFTDLLRTPRAIDRYIAQLKHHLPLLSPDEIDDEDVMLLTLVRVALPALFNALPKFRDELITGHTGEIARGGTSIEHVRFRPEPLLDLAPTSLRATARTLLISLFPKPTWEQLEALDIPYPARTRRGIASENYFDRYFVMGVPSNDLPDADVRNAVLKACGGLPESLVDLLTHEDEERTQLVLVKATSSEYQPTSTAQCLELTKALVLAANRLPYDRLNSFGSLGQILAWTGSLLGSVAGHVDARAIGEVLDELEAVHLKVNAMDALTDQARQSTHADATIVAGRVADQVADQAVAGFLGHVGQGDDAPVDSPQYVLRRYAIARGKLTSLREGVEEILALKQLDLSHLASRFVSAHGPPGLSDSWTLYERVDQDAFDEVAPSTDDPWYTKQLETDLDTSDLSWANRRRFAAGRFRPPPSAVAEP